jgi:hypothetical protein
MYKHENVVESGHDGKINISFTKEEEAILRKLNGGSFCGNVITWVGEAEGHIRRTEYESGVDFSHMMNGRDTRRDEVAHTEVYAGYRDVGKHPLRNPKVFRGVIESYKYYEPWALIKLID